MVNLDFLVHLNPCLVKKVAIKVGVLPFQALVCIIDLSQLLNECLLLLPLHLGFNHFILERFKVSVKVLSIGLGKRLLLGKSLLQQVI